MSDYSEDTSKKEHVKQLQKLQEKDPEFYQFLKENDTQLLDFGVEDSEEDAETDLEDGVEAQPALDKVQQLSGKSITNAMVDSWCKAIKDGKLGAVRSLLRAFRTACHYGDDGGNDSKFSVISSNVFNRIMVFVLNEMDGILRELLKAPSSGGKKEIIMDLMTTTAWNKNGSLMKAYLTNALHILTQMTDEQMISFTLKRVKASAVFLAAFPTLLRKYIKVALHSWGTGRGALQVVSFLFLRDLCVRLGSDCLDTCLKGVYKAYVMNCKLAKSVSKSKLQHMNFLGNCVTELCGVDIPIAYQHAFVFIRQLAVILRGALTEKGNKEVKDKTKDKKQPSARKHLEKPYQKVYDWQFISCLELWTGVICAYNAEADFRPLAYPLSQIISGVASLVPTARYFPLRFRCVKMLNRLAGATDTFIPVSSYLLDMLEIKELNKPTTGGVGKAVNLLSVKQVDKAALKTRAFQEACIYSVVEELAEHLAQWSYSVAFFELSFVPLVRLRSFCKSTNIDRFRKEIKELIRQVEANSEFINSKRVAIAFSPNDPAAESFLKAEKESRLSPLSKFAANLRIRAQQRSDSMVESSVIVGTESSVFGSKLSEIEDTKEVDGDEEGDAVFSSSWLPEKKPKAPKEKTKASKKRRHDEEQDVGSNEDLLEDLVLSSDDDDDGGSGGDEDGNEPTDNTPPEDEMHEANHTSSKQLNKKQKFANSSKEDTKKGKSNKKSRKRWLPKKKKVASN